MINAAGVPAAVIARGENAIADQINNQVRPLWHTPLISFDQNGWQVWIATPTQIQAGFPGLAAMGGFHSLQGNPAAPFAVVEWDGNEQHLSFDLSHEVIEMLIDPYFYTEPDGVPLEACDPVELRGYQIDGVVVSDFVTPAWFTVGARGPYDEMRMVAEPPGAPGLRPREVRRAVADLHREAVQP